MRSSPESWAGTTGGPELGLRSLLHRVTPRAKLFLEERLRFEALLSELSAGLIHVPATDIDAALELALQQVGTFLGVDRANLDEFVVAEAGMRISWAAPGLDEPPPVLDADQFPWTAARMARGELVRFARVAGVPPGAAVRPG